MFRSRYLILYAFLCTLFLHETVKAQEGPQTLTIKDALDSVVQNYGTIRAKRNVVKQAQSNIDYSKLQAIPDLNLSASNFYGTANGINGPSYNVGAGGIASSGPVMPSQNWNAAFGGLYLANVNWNFFSFGKIREGVKVSQANLTTNQKDLDQEIFQDQVKVCAAYLNLMGAQQLTKVAQDNYNRAVIVRNAVVPRVLSGLNAGVDSSIAVAQVSSAMMAWTRSKDREQELANELIRLLGTRNTEEPVLDTLFITRIPDNFLDTLNSYSAQHPVLQYYNSQILASREQEKYIHTQFFPTFNLFSAYQYRASGFKSDYSTSAMDAYSSNYLTGVGTGRQNYLVGVGVTWNLSNPIRLRKLEQAQRNQTYALQDAYAMNDQQLNAQITLANNKVKNALSNYYQIPTQLKAASDAFLQKTVQYKNGLNTIIDVQQALYLLNSAEIDKYIAYNNVWQALLIKAAAIGDLDVFLKKL
ncbi:MAG: transporter [Pseudopedobacter saltans]|uniref:Transporter n=1 Tax=Pseudopedobacter saltans TaxID=151895 RepID=A0A2W5GFQ5_9SPHI|nr:MAG: transporter [Pseudopedobacter saltans]